MKPKTPSLPQYVPPPAYQPASYTAPVAPDPSQIPQVLTPKQVMTQGAQVEGMLPAWLQLTTNPLDPSNLEQYGNNYYQQNIAPVLEAEKANAYSSGQIYGSYAGGRLGQMEAQGQLDKYNAGLSYGSQLLNNQIAGRQSYFTGGPQVATNQNNANVARGLGLFNAQNDYNMNSANMANQFNLESSKGLNAYKLGVSELQNNFSLKNFQNAMDAYNANLQAGANLGTALGGAGGFIGRGIGAATSAFGNAVANSRMVTGLGSGIGYGGVFGRMPVGSVGSFGIGTGLDIA